jgi:hypothetical protein
MNYSTTANEDIQAPLPILQVQNYPNPFNPNTLISFELPISGTTELEIYNLKGQLVKSYPAFTANKGRHQLSWNGISDSGAPCPSGVYFVRVKTGNLKKTHKMTLMK